MAQCQMITNEIPRLQMALLFSSVPCDDIYITATIGQAFSQEKRRKRRPDVTIFGWFSAFIRRCVIHHCLITKNKYSHRENSQCLS